MEAALDGVEETLRALTDVDVNVNTPGDLDTARRALPPEPIEAELTAAALRGTSPGDALSTFTPASIRAATGGAHGDALIRLNSPMPNFDNETRSLRRQWMRGASKGRSRLMTDERSPEVPSSVQQNSLESLLRLLMTMMRTVEEDYLIEYLVAEERSAVSESIKEGTKWLWSLLRYTKTE